MEKENDIKNKIESFLLKNLHYDSEMGMECPHCGLQIDAALFWIAGSRYTSAILAHKLGYGDKIADDIYEVMDGLRVTGDISRDAAYLSNEIYEKVFKEDISEHWANTI